MRAYVNAIAIVFINTFQPTIDPLFLTQFRTSVRNSRSQSRTWMPNDCDLSTNARGLASSLSCNVQLCWKLCPAIVKMGTRRESFNVWFPKPWWFTRLIEVCRPVGCRNLAFYERGKRMNERFEGIRIGREGGREGGGHKSSSRFAQTNDLLNWSSRSVVLVDWYTDTRSACLEY